LTTVLDIAVEPVDDFVDELTPVEEKILFSLVFDGEKAERRNRFVQKGLNRRQDHGSRGTREGHKSTEILSKKEFRKLKTAKVFACLRRNFRSAGRQITGTY